MQSEMPTMTNGEHRRFGVSEAALLVACAVTIAACSSDSTGSFETTDTASTDSVASDSGRPDPVDGRSNVDSRTADANEQCPRDFEQDDRDLDDDGLSNRREEAMCTDKRRADTDDDDLGDCEELHRGTDPCSED